MENKFMIGEYIQRCNPNGELLGEPFKATEIDFMFQDGRFVRAGNKTEELNNLKKQNEILAWDVNKLAVDNNELEKNSALLIEMLKKVTSELHYQIKSRGGEDSANTHWAVSQSNELLNNLKK